MGTYGLMLREYIKYTRVQDKSTNVVIGADEVVVVKKISVMEMERRTEDY